MSVLEPPRITDRGLTAATGITQAPAVAAWLVAARVTSGWITPVSEGRR